MPATFQNLFHSSNSPRDKFLSRLFGIFSEEVVRCWGKDNQSPYRNLGRPTIKLTGKTRGSTLDFAFESKSDGKVYVGEMKCELEYENYRYLTLESPTQLDHHGNQAFRLFLDIAKNISPYSVTVGGKPQPISGSILVWGRYTEQGRASVITKYGFHDVFSLETIIADLIAWGNKDFTELLDKRQTWTNELLSGLREIEVKSP
ncbi:MAG: hypothetical protein V9G20_26565 [Candidatus Promineifilaceae bacterium]